MKSIGISEVLNRFSDTVDIETSQVKHYGVQLYNAKGECRQLLVRKYTRGALQATIGADARAKYTHNLQQNGNVMLLDVDGERVIEVKATSIYGFRDFGSNDWQKVFH